MHRYIIMFCIIFPLYNQASGLITSDSSSSSFLGENDLTPRRQAPIFQGSSGTSTPPESLVDPASSDHSSEFLARIRITSTLEHKPSCLPTLSCYINALKQHPCAIGGLSLTTLFTLGYSVAQMWCNPITIMAQGSCHASLGMKFIGHGPLIISLIGDISICIKNRWRCCGYNVEDFYYIFEEEEAQLRRAQQMARHLPDEEAALEPSGINLIEP